ncbi:MAG: transglutaminase domain-containing protein [Acutalibacteraceae bacterium]
MKKRIVGLLSIILCLALVLMPGSALASGSSAKSVYLYGEQLSTNAKAIYDALKQIKPDTEKVTISLPDPITTYEEYPPELLNDVQSAMDAMLYDYPEIYWLKLGQDGCGVWFIYRKGLSGSTFTGVVISIVIQDKYKNNLIQTNESLESAVENFPVSGTTRYDKVKSIHDNLCRQVEYVENEFAHEATGSLLYGKAVCEGIAEAFKLICDYNDIPCVLVSGTGITTSAAGGSGPHMWNYVQMEDGNWYAVDVTWDDDDTGIIYNEYLLVGSNTVSAFFGDTFVGSHIESGDFSGAGIKEFHYPTLSENRYKNSTNSFEIKKDSQVYIEDECLKGVKIGDTVESVISQFNSPVKIVNNQDVEQTGVIKTGMLLINQYEIIMISVKYDVTGDGNFTSADLLLAKQIVLKTQTFPGAQAFAARVVNKDRTSSLDTFKMAQDLL